MNIGTMIRKLRRERDITQEQLAEYLNISVSAISQWECGKTAPDISQLPLLSNIFETSADIILGIDLDMKEKRIEEICMSAHKDSVAGYRERAVETLRKGLAEYPDSYKLKKTLIYGFDNVYAWDDELSLREIISLCRKVIDGSTDNEIREDTIYLACIIYPKTGKREEAIGLAKSMPIYQGASNELLRFIYTGDELIEQFKVNIMALNCLLVSAMLEIIDQKHDDGTPLYNDDEILLICQKIINIMETLFEESDFYYNSQYIRIAHEEMLKIYVNRMETENALAQLENVAKYAILMDTYNQKAEHTSILFRKMESGGYYKWSPDYSEARHRLKKISEPSFDFIRNEPRFIAVEAMLQKYTPSLQ